MDSIELAEDYRLVEMLKEVHPYAFSIATSYTSGELSVVGEAGRPTYQTDGLEFAWAGRFLLPYDRHQVRRIDIRDGRETTILKLSRPDEILGLVGSPNGKEACVLLMTESGHEIRLLSFDGTYRSTAVDVNVSPFLMACWAKRRVVLTWPGRPPRAVACDLESLAVGQTQTVEQVWAADPCDERTCWLHFPPPPSPREFAAMKPGGMTQLHRPTSQAAIILNDAELRVGEYGEPVHTELVARTTGRQYSAKEREYQGGHYGALEWSPDGRFLAATVAQWEVRPGQAVGTPYHLLVDLQSKEVVVGAGARDVRFATGHEDTKLELA